MRNTKLDPKLKKKINKFNKILYEIPSKVYILNKKARRNAASSKVILK